MHSRDAWVHRSGSGLQEEGSHIQALPLTYLIDKRGRIAASYAGVVAKDDLESNIQTVLKESKR